MLSTPIDWAVNRVSGASHFPRLDLTHLPLPNCTLNSTSGRGTPSTPPAFLSATSDLTSIPLFCFDLLRGPLPITVPSTLPLSPGLASAGRPLVCYSTRPVTPTSCSVPTTAWPAERGVRQTHWIRKSLEHRLSGITWACSCNQTFHSLHPGLHLSSVKTHQTHVHPAARAHILNPWPSGIAANAMRRRGNL